MSEAYKRVGESFAEYAVKSGINQSRLKALARSPLHFISQDRQETRALLIGKAIDCAIFERDTFGHQYVRAPKFDRRTKDGKAQAEEFEREHAGKVLLSEDDWRTVTGAVESLINHPVAARALASGESQVSAYWTDPLTGVACKMRADVWGAGVIVDLKSSRDASLEAFSRSAHAFGYHLQAGFYSMGYAAVEFREPESFLFVVVETEPPYAVAVYEADQAFRDAGRKEVQRLLIKYAECEREQRWPGYPETVQVLSLPRWAEKQIEEVTP